MPPFNRRTFLQRAAGLALAGRALAGYGAKADPMATSNNPKQPATVSADKGGAATHVPVAPDADPKPEVWNVLPVRALLMWSPSPNDLALFCRFIREALPKEGVNTLVVMFDFRYQYKSHPELAERNALSHDQVRQILKACRDAGVMLIPEMNLLAHQSEQEQIGILLTKYPQFDESPDFGPPHPWRHSGLHGFYSKCLCPRHPDLFNVIFPLMDELIEACEADAFHVGLDEAWIVAHDTCPRCGGRDPAEVFARYTTQLHDHLAEKGCRMWMWSDRLLDGKETGLSAWQASLNNTHRAIDMIPKDIVICDWKYEDAPPTPSYFAVKGFDVLPSCCYNAEAALAQLEEVYHVRKNASRASYAPTISSHMRGVFATSWMSAGEFIQAYNEPEGAHNTELAKSTTATFKSLFAAVRHNQGI